MPVWWDAIQEQGPQGSHLIMRVQFFELMYERETNCSRGFGFLELYNHACAEAALTHMKKEGYRVGGQSPSVTYAEPRRSDSEDRHGRTLYIGNLAPNTTEEALRELLTQFGAVVQLSIIHHTAEETAVAGSDPKPARVSRGAYAFCYMEHKQAALNTLAEAETLTGLQLNGRKLIVQKARGSGREAAEGEGAVHGRAAGRGRGPREPMRSGGGGRGGGGGGGPGEGHGGPLPGSWDGPSRGQPAPFFMDEMPPPSFLMMAHDMMAHDMAQDMLAQHELMMGLGPLPLLPPMAPMLGLFAGMGAPSHLLAPLPQPVHEPPKRRAFWQGEEASSRGHPREKDEREGSRGPVREWDRDKEWDRDAEWDRGREREGWGHQGKSQAREWDRNSEWDRGLDRERERGNKGAGGDGGVVARISNTPRSSVPHGNSSYAAGTRGAIVGGQPLSGGGSEDPKPAVPTVPAGGGYKPRGYGLKAAVAK